MELYDKLSEILRQLDLAHAARDYDREESDQRAHAARIELAVVVDGLRNEWDAWGVWADAEEARMLTDRSFQERLTVLAGDDPFDGRAA